MTVPVVIDCYAVWCKPCREYSPVFNRVAAEYAGKAVFYRLNVDEKANEKVCAMLEIRNIPSTVVFFSKNQYAKAEGTLTEAGLKDFIRQVTSQ